MKKPVLFWIYMVYYEINTVNIFTFKIFTLRYVYLKREKLNHYQDYGDKNGMLEKSF